MKQKKTQQPNLNLADKPDSQRRSHKGGTFADHIAELRRRLMWIALVFVGGSAIAYTYNQQLADVIMSPLNGQKLVYLTPGGGFSFIFQVSIYSGLIVAAPFIVHHLYAFIRPALPTRAQRSAGKVVLSALALIIIGISYGYFVAVPAALHFLSSFAGDSVTPNLTADSYLSFFLSYIAGLALLSLLPLFLIFWHWIKPLTPGGLLRSERWVILFAFVVAAIITPTPDAANQAMIAGPVILLYQLGVAAVMVSVLRHKRAARRVSKLLMEQPLADEQLAELLAEPEWLSRSTKQTLASCQTTSQLPTKATRQQTSSIALQPPDVAQRSQRQRRAMDVIARPAAQPVSQRPITTDRYSQHRPVARHTSRRSQLSLDGIFAPMQAA